MTDQLKRDIETLRAWLREPDYAERFTYADAASWTFKRPLAEFERIATLALSSKEAK